MSTPRKRYVPPPAPRPPAGTANPASPDGGSAAGAGCPKCGAAAAPGEDFCANCGSPLNAAVEARQKQIQLDKKKILARAIKRNWGAGSGYIMGAAVIQFIVALVLFIMCAMLPAVPVIAPLAVTALGGIFLGLWFWARKHPLPALVTALVVYVLSIFTVNAAGLVVHIITIGGLAGGIRAALVNRRLARRLGDGRPLKGSPGRWR